MSTVTRNRNKTRPFSSWKREVWGIVRGLPLWKAAATIRRIADDSLQADEITRRSYDAAFDWADRIQDRVQEVSYVE